MKTLKTLFVAILLGVAGLVESHAQPTGAINGLFSIAEGQYVCFSKGNLQYQASTNIWRFADYQYDIVGSGNSSISSTYSGWIDLFGFGTSGFDHGAVCYQPWSTSTTASDYYAYGSETCNLFDNNGQADWGYNKISNGGDQYGLWRTLTSDEWNYILNGRSTYSGVRYVKATVNGVRGLILLPDSWNVYVYTLNRPNAYWVQFDTNVISASDWTNVLEAHGAVFIPVANNRAGSSYQQILGQGMYRTANPGSVLVFYDSNSYGIGDSWVGTTGSGVGRYFGYSVRLVNTPSQGIIYSVTTGVSPSTGGKTAGAGSYMYGAQCTLHATPNGHYTFVRWLKNGSQVSTNPTYSFTVTESANYVAEFAAPVGGTGQLNGVFSIDENTQVNFSKGNLQYQASTNTWRFAMNQYEHMGAENENVSPSYSGWIDLFGWGTSGYNHGANCYQPWSTSNNNGDYYAYGQPGYNLSDQSGKADWGYNAISNGGNSTNSGWRTLTSQEWDYLFNNRFTASGARYAKATVNGIGGVILLPDDWNASLYSLDDINNSNADYLNNNITDSEWTNVFETAGAVFLPAAARMISGSIVEEDEFAAMYKAFGFYWSSSAYDNDRVKGLYFYGAFNSAAFFLNEAFLSANNFISRNNAASVRLVRPTQNTTYVIGASPSSNEYGTVSGAGLYLSGQVCSLTATANTGYTFTCWTYNGRLVSTNPTYSFVVTENATCKAEFAPNSYGISVSANPSNGGSVSGGGVYLFGSSCTVSAIPNENCSFMYWTVNGVQVSTNAEYTFTVSSDCNLMAHFSLPEVVTYSISASSNLSGGGSIQGTGEYPGNSTCTLMAIANEGYVFESWTEGEFTVSNDAVFSFTVTGNRNLIANYVVSSVGDYVDLGLPSGVLWAACNLGTYKSGSYGDKFAWGETETKDQFNWDSYLYSNGSLMTKYCNNSNYGYNGFTDNLTVLLPMDDAATANWGPAWRMPTIDEWRELLEHTTHTRVYVDGNIGCLFAGTNGNSIFIPIYDYNYPYWSSSLDVEEPDGAMCFSRYQFSETVDYSYFRRDGNYVRPVRSGSQSCVIGGVADPPEGGSVSGSGNYNIGSTVTISASPSAGYHFVRWTKNGKPVSTNPTHSFTVKTNVSYVAEFSRECNISAVSNPSEGGTISGAGTYEYGTTATLAASANEGYSFAGWTKNGSVVSNNAVYTFTITGDGEFVANFNQNSYYISASVNSSGGGTVIGGGSYSYGSTASLIATADICYKFSCWKKNGVVVSLNPIYNYTVTENASFEAFFEKNRFTIFVSADPSEGGDVSGAGVFNKNSTCLLKAVPSTGYSFEYWTKNGSVVSTSLSYSFMVTEDADYVAVFSQNNYAVSVAVIPSQGGTVSGAGNYQQGQTCTLNAVANNGYTFANWTENDVQISTDATYSFPVTANRNLVAHFLSTTSVSITASANPTDGGTVSGMGAFYIGSTCTLIATANPGYSFMYWTQNGNQVSSNATYSFTVAGDCDLVAHFSPPLTITASTTPSMGGGSVTGGGIYDYGATCTLTATANPGYSFIKWTMNGSTISYLSPFSFSVTEDADYVAVFEVTAGVVIGESEGTNVYLPSYSFYNHTLSQQIYTSEEIGESTLIAGISFFNTGGQKTRSYDIYLVHTDKLSFSNNKDWITVAESDRVFSGDVTMMTGCWTTIVLDTPFTYNGTSNLAVVIDDNSGNYTGSPHMSCRVFNTQGNQAIRIYSDGTNYDPYNPSGYNGTLYSEKNQIVFRNTLTFDISVTANLTGGGTVAGAGSYENGTTCTLTATANPGYTFIKWTRNREDVSYLSPFSFSVSEGGDYVAVFEETSGVVVGVPEGTNQYVPSYPLNSYALSQQIYTNDEIGESGVITDLSFFNTGEQSTRNYDIYLVHTDKSDFGTVAGFMIILQGKDWIAVTESDRVFSGAVTMATGCWTTITLDTPFAYNGISNLAVVIDDNTGSGSGDMSCRAFHDQDRQAVSVCSDGTNYDPFNPSGYGITSHSLKNQMVFQISPFNITALANPTEGGTVSGSGIYQQGQTCTLTATAYTGYAFTSWTENGVVVSTDATYSFTFSGNRTLVANFSYRNYTITASSNLSAGGTVSGAGDYIYGSTCTLTATANPGYTFIKWTKNGSDFSYRSPYSFSVAEDADFVAVFEETTGVVVGGPQAVNAYLPSCSFREFSLSQQIYTKDEIGGKGVITGLSFFNTWDQFTRNFDIYLVHTDKTAFGSDTDWIAVSESDLVFSGDVDMMTGCWTTIVFDTPFTYNGTSNLAIVVDDNTDIQYLSISNLSCRVFDTQELQAIRIFGNGNNYDPYNPSGYVGTRYSVKNQVVIQITSIYDITASANLSAGGTVTGAGSYQQGQGCTLTATANPGYTFIKWTKNGSTVSYLSPFSFSVTEDADYVAVFEETAGIVIGVPEGTNRYLPSYSLFNYTLSQQIYTNDEIGESGGITSLSFFNTGSQKTRNYDIYLVHTDKTSFSSNTDWITVMESDRVFSGNVTMMSGCWTTIVLDRPFVYDGSSNLAVVIDDNTGRWSSGMSCRVFNTQGAQAIRVYSDGTNYNPFNPSEYNGTLYSEKNQIVFHGIDSQTQTQTVSLSAGWNWFSTYIEADPVELLQMLEESLGENGIVIKSNAVSTDYYEDYGWYGDLDDEGLKSSQMYMIKTNAACTVELEGVPANPAEVGITIRHGWNWIGYPCAEAMSVADALAGFQAEDGDILKSSGASTDYYEGFGWYGELETMEPGEGFMYYSNSQTTKTVYFQTGAKKSLTGRKY